MKLVQMIVVISLAGCNASSPTPVTTERRCPGDPHTGLVPVLASPARFDRCRVEFTGWLTGYEEHGICLSESDARIGNAANCITLGTAQDESVYPAATARGRAFYVRGIFRSAKTMLVGSPGYLDDIEDVIDVTDPVRRHPAER
jgi:hypothetical protein